MGRPIFFEKKLRIKKKIDLPTLFSFYHYTVKIKGSNGTYRVSIVRMLCLILFLGCFVLLLWFCDDDFGLRGDDGNDPVAVGDRLFLLFVLYNVRRIISMNSKLYKLDQARAKSHTLALSIKDLF